MGPNLLQYSNGWGHLLMSLALLTVGVVLLILFPAVPPIQGTAIGLISSVAGIWLVSSAANHATRATTTNNPPAPAPAPGGPPNG